MRLQNEMNGTRMGRNSGGGGVSQEEYNRIKYELEETKKYMTQLQREKTANSLLGNNDSIDEEKVQKMMRDYLEEIERLKAENEDLRMMGSYGGGGGGDSRRVAELERENSRLKEKVRDLESELEVKYREISNLRKSTINGSGDNQEAMRALQETNDRLVQEINKLQDQIRKGDSSFNTNNSLSMLSQGNAFKY